MLKYSRYVIQRRGGKERERGPTVQYLGGIGVNSGCVLR